jgi:hypothetical protein
LGYAKINFGQKSAIKGMAEESYTICCGFFFFCLGGGCFFSDLFFGVRCFFCPGDKNPVQERAGGINISCRKEGRRGGREEGRRRGGEEGIRG